MLIQKAWLACGVTLNFLLRGWMPLAKPLLLLTSLFFEWPIISVYRLWCTRLYGTVGAQSSLVLKENGQNIKSGTAQMPQQVLSPPSYLLGLQDNGALLLSVPAHCQLISKSNKCKWLQFSFLFHREIP